MSNAVATTRRHTTRELLVSDQFKAQMANILPRHLTPDRMARVALTTMQKTPALAECSQTSFFNVMLTLAQIGLEPDGIHAHLIPFNTNKGGKIVQLIIDYKGLVALVMRSGQVSNIHADVVCTEDKFKFNLGEIVQHEIDFKQPRGEVYAVYCIARFKDGTKKCEVMSRDEVEGIRRRSKASNSGPWQTDWNEMAKKTVFKRLSKWLPMDNNIKDALQADDDVPPPIIESTIRFEEAALPPAKPTLKGKATKAKAQQEQEQAVEAEVVGPPAQQEQAQQEQQPLPTYQRSEPDPNELNLDGDDDDNGDPLPYIDV